MHALRVHTYLTYMRTPLAHLKALGVALGKSTQAENSAAGKTHTGLLLPAFLPENFRRLLGVQLFTIPPWKYVHERTSSSLRIWCLSEPVVVIYGCVFTHDDVDA